MVRALYSDLFLIFTPPATGGLINQVTIANFITSLYKKAALAAVRIYTAGTDSYLDDERVKGVIIIRASTVVNQWYASISIKQLTPVAPPKFDLTEEDKAELRSLLVFTFGFASREDTPIQETGDGD